MPNSPFFLADSATKGVPLQALPPSAWHTLIGTPDDDGTMTPLAAYHKVAWLYRAVDMRAKAVQKMPYQLLRGEEDVTKLPEFATLQRKLSDNLYRTEAALCLYGASYWMKDTNAFGLNVTPRWLLPSSILPDFDKDKGLVGFKRQIDRSGDTQPIKLQNIIYFWTPNMHAEIGPGSPPARVAMMAAGSIYSMDLFTKTFFDRGMIKAVILTLEGNPPPGEAEKLGAWWRRIGAGVKSAWNAIVVRSTVKPVVIGDGLKDSTNDKLTALAREDIATALGVPHSLMASNALAGGTAQAEQLNFYDQTIIPECDLISENVNAQWLEAEGVTLKFLPHNLEIFQQLELTKASAVMSLVGRPIFTVNEGRALLDKAPLTPDELGQVAQSAVHVKPTGETLAPLTSADQLPKLVPVKKPDAGAPKALDFRRWEQRTLKRLREKRPLTQPFESDHISASEHTKVIALLRLAQSDGDVKAAFAAGKRGRVRAGDLIVDTQVIATARAKLNKAKA